MKRMKKGLLMIMSLAVLTGVLAGCGGQGAQGDGQNAENGSLLRIPYSVRLSTRMRMGIWSALTWTFWRPLQKIRGLTMN